MNEKQLFESGCFLPCWTEDTDKNETSISFAYARKNKDLDTLLQELDSIKEHIQEIQAKQWQLAKLIHFHEHEFAGE